MGRRVPGDNIINISLIGPFLYYSFSFVGLAASIAIITALCSVRFRRKSPSVPRTLSDPLEVTKALNASSPNAEATATATATTISISPEQNNPRTSEAGKLETTNATELAENNNNEVLLTKELPLPPAMQQPHKDSKIAKRATSERRLSFNLSMKMPRSLSMARNRGDQKVKEDDDGGKREKVKADESVWMKTIILGGKCVPDEEEDAVIYEGKGKKISAYHPRNSTSMSLSRQWSSIALDSLSVPQPQSHDERINNI